MPKKPRNANMGYGSSSCPPYDAEDRPLLPNRLEKRGNRDSRLAIFVIVLFLCPVLYYLYWYWFIPAEVRYYKGLYDVVSTEVTHLGRANVVLEGRVGELEGELRHYKGLYLDVQMEAQRLEKENGALVNQVDALEGNFGRCKVMYEDVRIRAQNLTWEKSMLEGEVHDLKDKVRGLKDEVCSLEERVGDLDNEVRSLKNRLTKSKVEAFWEIARVMDTNADVWVGADDPGAGPKFWSYGITNGRYHHDNPAVTTLRLLFSSAQAAAFESTDQRRVVGYRIESNQQNNGWWMLTGLDEFGEAGSRQLQFSAKQGPRSEGAKYEAVVFYAEWNQ